MRCVRPFLLTVICAMSGCASTMSISPQMSGAIIQEKDPSCSPQNIAKLQPGSEISIVESLPSGSTMLTRGIVLKSGPEGIALINCVRMSSSTSNLLPSYVPGSRLFKTSGCGATHVPVHWIPASQLTSLTIDNPPPEDFVAPNIALDMNNGTFYERIGIDFNFDTKDGPAPKGLNDQFIPWEVKQNSSTSQ